jgi:hypothetical protein
MVQPKYSPQEALERIKLMMNYDSSKTLNENKEVIKEQYVAPAVAAGATGAGLAAGATAAGVLPGTATVAGLGTVGLTGVGAAAEAVAGALGIGITGGAAVVGGAAALAVLPLAYWLITKDTGMNKVKKMFEMCSSEATKIAKLPRKLQDSDLRSISDDIEDAVNYQTLGFMAGTDEEKLFGAFKQLEGATASDFCALVQYYNKNSDSGDLFDDLDSDIDAESEWKQIFRPIRNCVEDSLLSIKDDAPIKTDGGKTGGAKTGGVKKTGTFTACTENMPIKYGCKNETIKKVQVCLGLPMKYQTGNFGPITKQALIDKGQNGDQIDSGTIRAVCKETQPTTQPTTQSKPIFEPDDTEELSATDILN